MEFGPISALKNIVLGFANTRVHLSIFSMNTIETVQRKQETIFCGSKQTLHPALDREF